MSQAAIPVTLPVIVVQMYIGKVGSLATPQKLYRVILRRESYDDLLLFGKDSNPIRDENEANAVAYALVDRLDIQLVRTQIVAKTTMSEEPM